MDKYAKVSMHCVHCSSAYNESQQWLSQVLYGITTQYNECYRAIKRDMIDFFPWTWNYF